MLPVNRLTAIFKTIATEFYLQDLLAHQIFKLHPSSSIMIRYQVYSYRLTE